MRIHSFDAEKHKYPTVQVTETHGGTEERCFGLNACNKLNTQGLNAQSLLRLEPELTDIEESLEVERAR